MVSIAAAVAFAALLALLLLEVTTPTKKQNRL